MDSPLEPTAKITLDKERTLRMDLNAYSDFEMMTGKSILRGGLDFENLQLADIRALAWACLVQEDESLTLRDVGKLVHAGNLAIVTNAIGSLSAAAMPEPEEGSAPVPLAEKAKRSATASGGTSSGPQPDTTSD